MNTQAFKNQIFAMTAACGLGLACLISGCTQSRSSSWAQRTPAVKASPAVMPQDASTSSQLLNSPMAIESDHFGLAGEYASKIAH